MRPPPDWLEALPRHRLLAEMSLWSADLGRIAEEVARVDAVADLYHLDVADGHFAPGLLLFPDLVRSIRRRTARPLHVHLMVGDESALPAIAASLEAVPRGVKVVVRLVCDGPDHQIPLESPGDLDLLWAHRSGDARTDAALLPAAVERGVTILNGTDVVGTVAEEIALLQSPRRPE